MVDKENAVLPLDKAVNTFIVEDPNGFGKGILYGIGLSIPLWISLIGWFRFLI
ncbi:hypothetical protein [Aneurinibacillus tyrosinisolvens]|uniref:hypothetical protein n=1 Tax=Aneurinibacillus tyrosinisolvens TaxID=1443435 RepID=UPI000B05D172|nr:hypothetical protein [Aneurinibacillus tyrosinisolvens]